MDQLITHTQSSQGFLPVQKGDFITLFWPAWIFSFVKETILTPFKATGMWPKDSEVILKRFKTQTLAEDEGSDGSLLVDGTDWSKMRKSSSR